MYANDKEPWRYVFYDCKEKVVIQDFITSNQFDAHDLWQATEISTGHSFKAMHVESDHSINHYFCLGDENDEVQRISRNERVKLIAETNDPIHRFILGDPSAEPTI